MKQKFFFTLLLSLWLLSPLMADSSESPPPPSEYSWLMSSERSHGDIEGYMVKLIGQVLQNPDSPYVPLVLERLREAESYPQVYSLLKTSVPLLLKGKIKNGYVKATLKGLYGSILRSQGRFQEVKALNLNQGYLIHWHVLGPFGHSGKTLYYRVFQAELDQKAKEMEYGKVYEGIRGDISWKKVKAKLNTLMVFEKLRPKKGCGYAMAQIHMDSRKPVILVINNTQSFKAWLNGQKLFSAFRQDQYLPYSITLPVYLEKGWSRLFFKVPPSSSYGNFSAFSVRVLDIHGNPITVKEETGKKFHPLPGKKLSFYKGGGSPTPFEYYSQKAAGKPSSPWARMAKGALMIQRGFIPQGLDLIEKVKDQEPENLYFLQLWIQALHQAPFIPSHLLRNRAKETYEKILKKDPRCLAPYLYLARYYKGNDKPLKAITILEEALQKTSSRLEIYYTMAQICFDEKWEAQGIAYLKRCEEINPHWTRILQFWERYYTERGNYEKAWKYTQKLLQKSKQTEAILHEKAQYLLERGKRKEAFLILMALHKKKPKDPAYLQALYQYYLNQNDFAKALGFYEKLTKDAPDKGDVYETLGELYLKDGKKDMALHWLKLALREKPNDHTLRSYISFLEGKEWDYASKYALKAQEYIKRAPGGDQYPKAHSLIVIDQTVLRIYSDGSTSETSHLAHKIFDEEGKERYHRANVRGEIYELRTFDKDGKIWEPIIPDQGNIVPPALGPGAVLEQRYRSEGGSHRPFEFRWGPFFFKDSNYDEPVMISQLVVIASNKYPVKFLQKNINKAPKVIKEGDDTVYIWTFENQDRTEIERYMPSPNELLPHVRIYTNQKLEEHIWMLEDRYSADVRVTPQIQRETDKVLGPLKGKSEYEKAKALYEYVHKTIPQGWGTGAYGSAMRVLMEKRGDRGTLFSAMLKAGGIEYHHSYILSKENPIIKKEKEIQENLSYQAQFLLKVLPRRHKPLWVNCSVRNLPFGKIPEGFQGGNAYVFDGGRFYMEEVPQESKEKKATQFHFELTLLDSGDLKGIFSLILPGSQGDQLKEMIKTRPQNWKQNIVEGMTNRFFPGSRVEKFEFLGIGEANTPFQLKSHFYAPNYLRNRGGIYEFRPGLPPLQMSRVFSGKSKRIHDFLFPQSNSLLASLKVHLGKWSLKELPENLLLETKMGSYLYLHFFKGNTLSIERRFFLEPFRLEAAEYKDLLEWCRKIDSQERRNLILQK